MSDKRKMSSIANLFNRIAPHYDFLNHFLSFHIDKIWRKKALKKHVDSNIETVIDIACGTGDFSLLLAKKGVQKVIGIDLSEKMVGIAREKVKKARLENRIQLEVGDCAAIPFETNTFDVATVAFGVRNFEQREKSLLEICRVLKQGKELIVLEFSTPKKIPVKQLYHFYFKHILPTIGGLISGDKEAYAYLPESVYRFPQDDAFLLEMKAAGFESLSYKKMSFGIATTYYGNKK